MATTTSPRAEAAATPEGSDAARPCDVLVAFGNTGVLVKVMTFPALSGNTKDDQ